MNFSTNVTEIESRCAKDSFEILKALEIFQSVMLRRGACAVNKSY